MKKIVQRIFAAKIQSSRDAGLGIIVGAGIVLASAAFGTGLKSSLPGVILAAVWVLFVAGGKSHGNQSAFNADFDSRLVGQGSPIVEAELFKQMLEDVRLSTDNYVQRHHGTLESFRKEVLSELDKLEAKDRQIALGSPEAITENVQAIRSLLR
jgi:hypothetical protein